MLSGKGLGKKEDGMSRPVKPKFKFDNYGVGFNLGDEYKNNWWELMYNKAASNLSVIEIYFTPSHLHIPKCVSPLGKRQ